MEKCPLCGSPGCALFVGFCCNNIECSNHVPNKEEDFCDFGKIITIKNWESDPYMKQIQAEWSKMFEKIIGDFRIPGDLL